VKRCALYARVSTVDQTTANQLLDLRQMVQQRGYQVVEEYIDHGISGAKARRPALDRMMTDARRGQFDTVVVWAADRLARSVKHFVDVLSELDHLGVAFLSFREQIDTAGPLEVQHVFGWQNPAVAQNYIELLPEDLRTKYDQAMTPSASRALPPAQIISMDDFFANEDDDTANPA
jgi:DNA invertase Pin-like site-specific DNA recombinase